MEEKQPLITEAQLQAAYDAREVDSFVSLVKQCSEEQLALIAKFTQDNDFFSKILFSAMQMISTSPPDAVPAKRLIAANRNFNYNAFISGHQKTFLYFVPHCNFIVQHMLPMISSAELMRTMLVTAVTCCQKDTAQCLLRTKMVSINELDSSGRNMLQRKLQFGSNPVEIKFLVEECGARVTKQDLAYAAQKRTNVSWNYGEIKYYLTLRIESLKKAAITLAGIRRFNLSPFFNSIPKEVARDISKMVWNQRPGL